MPIGTILDTPNLISNYARVRDEYGSEYTVHGNEIEPQAEIGDDMAYSVAIWQHEARNATSLKLDPNLD